MDETISTLGGDDLVDLDHVAQGGIDLGAGDDTLTGSYFNNTPVDGGEGNDLIEISDSVFQAPVRGGEGDDTIRVDPYNSKIDGGSGDDLIDIQLPSALPDGADDEVPQVATGDGEDQVVVSQPGIWTSADGRYVAATIVDFDAEHDELVIDPDRDGDNYTYQGYEIEASDDGLYSAVILQYRDMANPDATVEVAVKLMGSPAVTAENIRIVGT